MLVAASYFWHVQYQKHMFVDQQYGFQFTYPADWLITSDAYNQASHGMAFQLSNFKHGDTALADSSKGQNIVYGTITYTTLSEILDNINNCHGDCDQNIFATSTTIAGQEAVVVRYKLKPDAPMTDYSISIASADFPKAVLNIGITGDPSNFHVLQDMLSTLQLIKSKPD